MKRICINCKYAKWTKSNHGLIGNCNWFYEKFKDKIPVTFIKIERYNIMYSNDTNVVSMYIGGHIKRINDCDAFEEKEDQE